MFGGILLNSNICPIIKHNVLLTVYSNKLYIFSLEQTHLINDIELSDYSILHFMYQQSTNSILAIDIQGNLITVTLNQTDITKFSHVSKQKISKQIIDGRIVLDDQKSQSKDFKVLYLSNNCLHQYHKNTGAKNIVSKNIHKILYSSKDYIVCSIDQEQTQISIFSLSSQSIKLFNSYKHLISITSIEIAENILIVGDSKGKIHILKGFLSNNYQQVKTIYEWHLHQVLALYCVGEYLYSAGEEGTVVMWHLRQNKRDFLPRIGTQINKIVVQSGIVYTLLSDNRINSIDLSNDKRMRNYCTIINPFGLITKQIHQDLVNKLTSYEDKSLIFEPITKINKILISSLPGSIQILDLSTGINTKLEIIQRNLVGRLDNQYPEPHQVIEAKLSKNGDILACSVMGLNCNILRFYKHQNFSFSLISKIQNPHKGQNFKICPYKNMFLTYSQSDPTIRFWILQTYKKKSIIQKQQQVIGCCGQLSFRQKNPIYVTSCEENDLIGVAYKHQIALISLKDKKVQSVFKTKQIVSKIELIKSGAKTFLILLSNTQITKYQLEKNQIINSKKIAEFNEQPLDVTLIRSQVSLKNKKIKLAILIKTSISQKIIEHDIQTSKNFNEIVNQSLEAKLNNICYINNKLFALSSKSGLYNLTDETSPVTYKQKSDVSFSFDIEQTHYEEQSLNSLHQNYVARHDHKMKSQIIQIDQKIQVQMYPSLQVGFKILMEKILY